MPLHALGYQLRHHSQRPRSHAVRIIPRTELKSERPGNHLANRRALFQHRPLAALSRQSRRRRRRRRAHRNHRLRSSTATANPFPTRIIEIWQANSHGKYAHPEDVQDKPLETGFSGYGRIPTDEDGRFRFTTIKPGRVPGPDSPTASAAPSHLRVHARPAAPPGHPHVFSGRSHQRRRLRSRLGRARAPRHADRQKGGEPPRRPRMEHRPPRPERNRLLRLLT